MVVAKSRESNREKLTRTCIKFDHNDGWKDHRISKSSDGQFVNGMEKNSDSKHKGC